MIRRTMDATFLNSVANHADVRPMLGGSGPLDLTGLLADPNNVGFECDVGGFVITKVEPGVYECHSMFLPDGRGQKAHDAMKEGLRYLFIQTDCIQIVTKCPETNKGASGAARAMGFSPMFTLEQAWPTESGDKVGVEVKGLHFTRWVQKDEEVAARGKWFHERLEQLAQIPEHFEDEAHNRAVGAACMMFEHGNSVKAQASYNLWARIAGFPLINVLSYAPLIIDMDQVVVGLKGGDMEILLCR